MTTTVVPTAASVVPAERPATRSLWRTGVAVGLAAAAATVAVASVAHALDVPIETAPGTTIPILAFGQLTLFFTAIGVLLARTIGRRARRPRSTLLRTTVGLTALSLIPDVMLSAGTSTKVTFVLTHLVAAAIVIPALASCVPAQGGRSVGVTVG
jgi:peptidoglycan/LPS O-acetylase OafA/YrhL